jgi:hypothetical protein
LRSKIFSHKTHRSHYHLANVGDEKRWKAALKRLKADLNDYDVAQKNNDEGLKKKAESNIIESPQRIGDSQSP